MNEAELATLGAWGAELRAKLEQQIQLKGPIERRWVEDIRQYHGRTSFDGGTQTEKERPKTEGEICGYNRTRSKVNTGTGRLGDLLFPGDDKNWAINPSPVPELIARMGDKTVVEHEGQTFQDETGEPITESALAMRTMEQAKEACRGMEREIEDQLSASNYGAAARRAMFDAGQLGTGILKGPVVEGRQRKSWSTKDGASQLTMVMDRTPVARHVSPWNFFPDMSAAKMDQCEYVFERVYVSRSGMKKMATRAGFNKAGYEAVMRMPAGSTAIAPTQSMNELRGMSGLQPASQDTRYEMWLYHGPVSTELLKTLGSVLPTDKADEIEEYYPAIVWMCHGTIIKAAVSPLDTGELPYSVFAWEEDESCLFGFGVPYLTRNTQNTLDRAWDSMIENSEKSAGPQIVVRKGQITPANGEWEIDEPFKVWYSTDKIGEAKHAFETYDFPNHQAQFAALAKDASAAMDEESLIPVLAQGEQGSASPTLGGMSMLMNASLTTVRAAVKRWDDEVTAKLVTRFYDWNMLNSEKEAIKGDFEVVATGSGSLLVREIVGAELRMILAEASKNPALAAWTKIDGLYKKYIATTHINPDEVVRTKEEYEKYIQDQQPPEAEQGSSPDQLKHDYEMAALEVKKGAQQVDIMKMESEERIALFKLRLEERLSESAYALEIEKLEKRSRVDLYKFQTEIKTKTVMGSGI
jgi:hypothetical protein